MENMDALDQFAKKQYVNLETFRKSGEGVRTPVWFVREGDALYVLTGPNAGKVKRIRRNDRVNIAPCKMEGTPTGPWSQAFACEVTDPALIQKVDRLMDKKYGLQKKLFRLSTSNLDRPATVLEIRMLSQESTGTTQG